MSNGTRCRCGRCTMRGLMGPVVLITVGGLFLVAQMGLGVGFGKLWPVILIVIGLVKLMESLASTAGHIGPGGAPPPQPPPYNHPGEGGTNPPMSS